MDVKVLRPFWYGGKSHAVGTKLNLPEPLAREVIYGGKAERVVSTPAAKPAGEPPPAAEPTAPTKQPMTTKSAGALTGKKGD